MKIVSDVGDPAAVVTNAEVAAFFREKKMAGRPKLVPDAPPPSLGHMPKLTDLVLRYIKASPAGAQSVAACCALREKLKPYGLSNEEFVQICNLRADHDDLLERVLRQETLDRLTDEQWGDVLYIINDTLEPRVAI
jgi:hypothetical protein